MSNQRKRVVWDPLSTKKFDAVTKAEAAFTAITAVDGLISDDEARRAAAKDAQAASDDENLGYDSDSSSSSASTVTVAPEKKKDPRQRLREEMRLARKLLNLKPHQVHRFMARAKKMRAFKYQPSRLRTLADEDSGTMDRYLQLVRVRRLRQQAKGPRFRCQWRGFFMNGQRAMCVNPRITHELTGKMALFCGYHMDSCCAGWKGNPSCGVMNGSNCNELGLCIKHYTLRFSGKQADYPVFNSYEEAPGVISENRYIERLAQIERLLEKARHPLRPPIPDGFIGFKDMYKIRRAKYQHKHPGRIIKKKGVVKRFNPKSMKTAADEEAGESESEAESSEDSVRTIDSVEEEAKQQEEIRRNKYRPPTGLRAVFSVVPMKRNWFYRNILYPVAKKRYKRSAVRKIQRAWRRALQRRVYIAHYTLRRRKVREHAVATIERWWRVIGGQLRFLQLIQRAHQAARIIQKNFRFKILKGLIRRHRAKLRIARFCDLVGFNRRWRDKFRQILTLHKMQRKQEETKQQMAEKEEELRILNAATTIQAAYRGFISRKDTRHYRLALLSSAIALQQKWRGHRQRRLDMKKAAEERNRVIRLQAVCRRWLTQRAVKRKIKLWHECATRLQSRVRRWLATKATNSLRQWNDFWWSWLNPRFPRQHYEAALPKASYGYAEPARRHIPQPKFGALEPTIGRSRSTIRNLASLVRDVEEQKDPSPWVEALDVSGLCLPGTQAWKDSMLQRKKELAAAVSAAMKKTGRSSQAIQRPAPSSSLMNALDLAAQPSVASLPDEMVPKPGFRGFVPVLKGLGMSIYVDLVNPASASAPHAAQAPVWGRIARRQVTSALPEDDEEESIESPCRPSSTMLGDVSRVTEPPSSSGNNDTTSHDTGRSGEGRTIRNKTAAYWGRKKGTSADVTGTGRGNEANEDDGSTSNTTTTRQRKMALQDIALPDYRDGQLPTALAAALTDPKNREALESASKVIKMFDFFASQPTLQPLLHSTLRPSTANFRSFAEDLDVLEATSSTSIKSLFPSSWTAMLKDRGIRNQVQRPGKSLFAYPEFRRAVEKVQQRPFLTEVKELPHPLDLPERQGSAASVDTGGQDASAVVSIPPTSEDPGMNAAASLGDEQGSGPSAPLQMEEVVPPRDSLPAASDVRPVTQQEVLQGTFVRKGKIALQNTIEQRKAANASALAQLGDKGKRTLEEKRLEEEREEERRRFEQRKPILTKSPWYNKANFPVDRPPPIPMSMFSVVMGRTPVKSASPGYDGEALRAEAHVSTPTMRGAASTAAASSSTAQSLPPTDEDDEEDTVAEYAPHPHPFHSRLYRPRYLRVAATLEAQRKVVAAYASYRPPSSLPPSRSTATSSEASKVKSYGEAATTMPFAHSASSIPSLSSATTAPSNPPGTTHSLTKPSLSLHHPAHTKGSLRVPPGLPSLQPKSPARKLRWGSEQRSAAVEDEPDDDSNVRLERWAPSVTKSLFRPNDRNSRLAHKATKKGWTMAHSLASSGAPGTGSVLPGAVASRYNTWSDR